MPRIKLPNGETLKVAGDRFSHYVGPHKFRFFYHKSVEKDFRYEVSHYESGIRVCEIPQQVFYGAKDTKSAAKIALDQLIAKVGAERVCSVLWEAEEKPIISKPLELSGGSKCYDAVQGCVCDPEEQLHPDSTNDDIVELVSTLASSLLREAQKRAIDQLVERLGVDRVYSVLMEAEANSST